MKRLTKKEEFEYLKQCAGKQQLDNGSSRVVYCLKGDLVCKVAMSSEGRAQNNREVFLYKHHSLNGTLAKIHSFGKYIIIMQEVGILSEETVDDLLDYKENFKDAKAGEIFSDVISDLPKKNNGLYFNKYETLQKVSIALSNTYEALENFIGFTPDNKQIGVDINGNFLCYDYGFDPGRDLFKQAGSVDEWDVNLEHSVPEIMMDCLTKKINFKKFDKNLKRNYY